MERRAEMDVKFHRELPACIGVRPLAVFDDLLWNFFDRFRRGFPAAARDACANHHGTLLDALRDGNTKLSGDTMRKHVEYRRRAHRVGPAASTEITGILSPNGVTKQACYL